VTFNGSGVPSESDHSSEEVGSEANVGVDSEEDE